MTFNLTTDELKVAECGSVDFKKFTDPKKGYANLQASENDKYGILGTTFTAQDVLNENFTLDEAKSIINSLFDKKVLFCSLTLEEAKIIDKNNCKTYLKNCLNSFTDIDGKWMFMLSEEFINYIAEN